MGAGFGLDEFPVRRHRAQDVHAQEGEGVETPPRHTGPHANTHLAGGRRRGVQFLRAAVGVQGEDHGLRAEALPGATPHGSCRQRC